MPGKIASIDGKIKTSKQPLFFSSGKRSEIAALITFEVQLSSIFFGLFSICFPYPVLENLLDKLSTQHIFQGRGVKATEEERNNIVERLNITGVDVQVELGSTNIALNDFLELKVGDVVKLDNTVRDSLIVKINNENKYYATPGINRNKVSIKITDEYEVTD
jgi:flagellar motor switch protein FliM